MGLGNCRGRKLRTNIPRTAIGVAQSRKPCMQFRESAERRGEDPAPDPLPVTGEGELPLPTPRLTQNRGEDSGRNRAEPTSRDEPQSRFFCRNGGPKAVPGTALRQPRIDAQSSLRIDADTARAVFQWFSPTVDSSRPLREGYLQSFSGGLWIFVVAKVLTESFS